ncbi:hypothetical protein [Paenibacillus harenae]|uniref:hypothetical protein n=1 Tax=Paenibacillus harenae TaxID=306543 RepID=UPI0003FF2188|nr:hypothetical protein [Paenibacillus harenae]
MRVSLFLGKDDYKFAEWEHTAPEIKKLAANSVITVSPGPDRNHASICIVCSGSLSLKFMVRDLHQAQSSLIRSMEESVIADYEHENYDYWGQIPPFGVVELYAMELLHDASVSEAELEALFRLTELFLIDHFMMFTFRANEIEKVQRYMKDTIRSSIQYAHQGAHYFRFKPAGW